MRPFLFGYDFFYYWASGKLVGSGGNPYDIKKLEEQLLLIGWPTNEVPVGLPNPPVSLWIYWILARIPFRIAMAIWVAVSLVISGLCGLVVNPLVTTQSIPRTMTLLATLMFPPVISNFFWGQINVIPLLGISLFGHFFQRQQMILAGLWLSLVLCKPHSVLALLVAVVLWELSQRRHALLVGLTLGTCLQCLATYLVSPDSFGMYLSHGTQVMSEASRICGATLGQMLACETGWEGYQFLMPIVGVILGVFLLSRFGYSARTLLCLLLPLSSLTAPYGWSHTNTTLLPSYLAVVGVCLNRWSSRKVRYVLILIGVVSVPIALVPTIQYPWITLSLSLLLVNLYIHRTTLRITFASSS